MYQSIPRFNSPPPLPPPGIPLEFDACAISGGGKFDHYTNGVGNLNYNFDFVLRVPLIERGLINNGGGLHVARNGEFKDLKENIAAL